MLRAKVGALALAVLVLATACFGASDKDSQQACVSPPPEVVERVESALHPTRFAISLRASNAVYDQIDERWLLAADIQGRGFLRGNDEIGVWASQDKTWDHIVAVNLEAVQFSDGRFITQGVEDYDTELVRQVSRCVAEELGPAAEL